MNSLLKKNKTANKLLKINIDGDWKSHEFSTFFESISFLYQCINEIESIIIDESQLHLSTHMDELYSMIMNIDGELYKKLNFSSTYDNTKYFEGHVIIELMSIKNSQRQFFEDLEVKEIKFASPGFTDFIGIGKIIEQLFALLKYYIPNKKQRLENDILEQDLLSKKAHYLQTLGYSKKDIRKFIDVKNNAILNLKHLELEGKITDYEIQDLN